MVSGHHLNRLSSPPPSKISEFIGTFIAVLTLTLPVFVVARYSDAPAGTAIAPALSRSSVLVRQIDRNVKVDQHTNGR